MFRVLGVLYNFIAKNGHATIPHFLIGINQTHTHTHTPDILSNCNHNELLFFHIKCDPNLLSDWLTKWMFPYSLSLFYLYSKAHFKIVKSEGKFPLHSLDKILLSGHYVRMQNIIICVAAVAVAINRRKLKLKIIEMKMEFI